jgi:hypothetical protein
MTALTPLIHPLTKTEKHVETVTRLNTQIPRQLATSTDSCAEPFILGVVVGIKQVQCTLLPFSRSQRKSSKKTLFAACTARKV